VVVKLHKGHKTFTANKALMGSTSESLQPW